MLNCQQRYLDALSWGHNEVLLCPNQLGSWLQPSLFPDVVDARKPGECCCTVGAQASPLLNPQCGELGKGLCLVWKSHTFGERRRSVSKKKSTGSSPSSIARTEQWESSRAVRRKETLSEPRLQKTYKYCSTCWCYDMVYLFSVSVLSYPISIDPN